MPKRAFAVWLFVSLLPVIVAAQAIDVSGTYSGTYSLSISRSGCPTPPVSGGSAFFGFQQSGSSVSGTFTLLGVTAFSSGCQTVSKDFSDSFSGTLNGNTLTATAATGGTASITFGNGSMSGSFSDSANGIQINVTFTGVRGGGQTGTSFTGTWTGSVSGPLTCGGSSVTQTFSAVATLQQSGTTVTGGVTISGAGDQCRTGSPNVTVTFPVNGTAQGNLFTSTFSMPGATNGIVVGVLASSFLSIGIGFDNQAGVFNELVGLLTNGTTGPPPALAVRSFVASPPSIRSGQSTTLSWSTQGATSVTIDNGIGAVALSGTKTVSPTNTTTYTLTATGGGSTVTSTATVTVFSGPIVNVTSFPSAMLQPAGVGGATTSYAVTNSGSVSTTITLSQSGSFFTQSPSSFTLAPDATQVVTITASAQPANSYEGASILPSGLQIPIKLLSVVPPTGTVTAQSVTPRVDVAAPSGGSPSGSVSFTNTGNATLTGILTSDVPWIIPQAGTVTIAPGATGTFAFTIDRAKRPDGAIAGSIEGNLTLWFLSGSGSPLAKQRPLDNPSTTPSVSLVKVVDTVQPAVTTAGIPALATGEVALFVAGAGHVVGTGGTQFVSDVNVFNMQGAKAVEDVKMYYTPLSGSASSSKTTSLPSVPGQVSVSVADVVKNVFSGSNEVGTVQIRSKDADKLAVTATVLTPNNPSGMYGNVIPILRSDRAVDASNSLVLTGLRKDGTTHTNLYIQEVAGSAANVQVDFLAADGSTIGSRPPEAIDAFKLVQLSNVVPANAVAAVITNTSTAGGKIAAYATPVDEASSDTWAVADWSKQFGYSGNEATIIPVAGTVHGANRTFYRTDVAITNRGTDPATGTLRYVSRTGEKIDRQVTLGAKQSQILNDVIGTTFGQTSDTTGYLIFTPASGSVAMTSRTFTTVGTGTGTFGSGAPTLPASSALKAGATRPIAGLADANRSTVIAGRPGTFRTNFALMETTGTPVAVRVTFRFTFPAGEKAQGIGAASRDYALNGSGFVMLNSIAGEVLGAARLQYGDLTNVEADFQVISGDGAVVLFTSSVDNATGDSILRTE